MTIATARTLVDEDREIPAKKVTGELRVHYVPSLDYTQYLIDGQHIDPKTLLPMSLRSIVLPKSVRNTFCATGEGGGVDPSCRATPAAPAKGSSMYGKGPIASRVWGAIEESKHSTYIPPEEEAAVREKANKAVDETIQRAEAERQAVKEHFEGQKRAMVSYIQGQGGKLSRLPPGHEAKRALRALVEDRVVERRGAGFHLKEDTENVFCPTGKGGGIDPTCSPQKKGHAHPPPGEKLTPASGHVHNPNPAKVDSKTGIALVPRVGVPGNEVPPPPKDIPRLPNLTAKERVAESRFADAYLANPDRVARNYKGQVESGKIGDGPNIYSTDDAKLLSPDYNCKNCDDDTMKDGRSTYNVAVHQTANAIAKRAFLMKLDELEQGPEDRKTVLVTSGGCASGKSYGLSKAEGTSHLTSRAGAVWDAAGEQNGAENPWVLDECKKRGLKAAFVFVHANPEDRWENPNSGVIERAGKKGRMVDARVYADSYAIGAKNFEAFHAQAKDDLSASFYFIDNASADGPKLSDSMPRDATKVDGEKLYAKAVAAIKARGPSLKPAVLRGGTVGERIWGRPKAKATENVFCATGEGGGIDASCSPGEHITSGLLQRQLEESHDWQRQVNKINARFAAKWQRLSKDSGMPNIKEAAAKALQEYVDRGDSYIRVPLIALPEILTDGRFKNQFETGNSEGLYNPDTRMDAEASIAGVPYDTPAHERPIYGYIGPKDFGFDSTIPSVAHYGNVVCKIKSSVRVRTTITGGDSLDTRLPASIAEHIAPHSILPSDFLEGVTLSPDVVDIHDAASWVQPYVEGQYHGGVSVKDIDEIQIETLNKSIPKKLQSLLKKHGIKWSIRAETYD